MLPSRPPRTPVTPPVAAPALAPTVAVVPTFALTLADKSCAAAEPASAVPSADANASVASLPALFLIRVLHLLVRSGAPAKAPSHAAEARSGPRFQQLHSGVASL